MPASSRTSACLSAGGDAVNYPPPGVHLCCIYVCVCQNRRAAAGGQIIWVYGLEQQCWVAEERVDGVFFLRHMDSGRWLIPATFLLLSLVFFVVTIFPDEWSQIDVKKTYPFLPCLKYFFICFWSFFLILNDFECFCELLFFLVV